jgi:hypothetical protein
MTEERMHEILSAHEDAIARLGESADFDEMLPIILAAVPDTNSFEIAEAICKQADRKRREYEHFEKWAEAEEKKGRNPLELTWGNCVRETGILVRKRPLS